MSTVPVSAMKLLFEYYILILNKYTSFKRAPFRNKARSK